MAHSLKPTRCQYASPTSGRDEPTGSRGKLLVTLVRALRAPRDAVTTGSARSSSTGRTRDTTRGRTRGRTRARVGAKTEVRTGTRARRAKASFMDVIPQQSGSHGAAPKAMASSAIKAWRLQCVS